MVIWDYGPAHRGPAMRAYLATPDLNLRFVALFSPGLLAAFAPVRCPSLHPDCSCSLPLCEYRGLHPVGIAGVPRVKVRRRTGARQIGLTNLAELSR